MLRFYIYIILYIASTTSTVYGEFGKCSANDLQAIQKYLNSFNTLQASFTEYNYGDEATIKQGVISVKKPNLIKIEYKSPVQDAIFINKDVITYYDHELDEVSHIKNDFQVLAFLSKKEIQLDRDFERVSCKVKGNNLSVSLLPKNRIKDKEINNKSFILLFLKQNFNIDSIFTLENNTLIAKIVLHNVKSNPIIDNKALEFKDKKFLDVEN